MLTRLRYLIDEGFQISSLSGYDDETSEFNAKIYYTLIDADGSRRVRSEYFHVGTEEMEQCCSLFLAHLK